MPKFLSSGPIIAYMLDNHVAPAKLFGLPKRLDNVPRRVKQRLFEDGVIAHKEKVGDVWIWDKGTHYPSVIGKLEAKR